MLLERRRVVHERAAQAIERLFAERLPEHYNALAHHYSRSANTTARSHLAEGLRLYEPQQHRTHAGLYSGHDPGVCCNNFAAQALWLLGYPDQAVASSQAAMVLAQQLAHPLSLALALYWAAVLHHQRREAPLTQARAEASAQVGQTAEGLEALAEALATLPKSRVRWWEAELYRLRGELLLQGTGGQSEEVAACFQQALAIARRQQAKSLELRAATSLSRLWQRQGKRNDARRLLAELA